MSKGKLLLADDSVTIQKVVNLTFADEGIEVVTTGNGDTAIQMIAETRPDIVLADVNMPGLNGYQICERLKQADETRGIPVLLLVGSFEPFDENEANRVGASGFMTKPFQSIRLLVTQVSELLQSAATPAGSESAGIEEPRDGFESSDLDGSGKGDELPQTTDIDELYNQSFAETIEMPAAAVGESDLGDSGMDDEMIEATYVSGDVSTEAFESASPFEERVSYETQTHAEPSGPNYAVENEAENNGTSEVDLPSFDQTQEMPGYDPASVWPPPEKPSGDINTPSFDAAALDSGAGQEEPTFALSDGDLLELPHAESRNPFAQPAVPVRQAPPTEQITSLSPELIDMIVEKVIERMAERH